MLLLPATAKMSHRDSQSKCAGTAKERRIGADEVSLVVRTNALLALPDRKTAAQAHSVDFLGQADEAIT
jgi:hypothetical protein